MTDIAIEHDRKASWPYWVITPLALLWNGFGAYDYVMSQTSGADYMRRMGMGDAQVAYMTHLPAWMVGCWAIGVWGAVAGSVLLAIRSRWAMHAFLVSLAGMVVNFAYGPLTADGAAAMTQKVAVMDGVLLAIGLLLAGYAWAMTKRGVLR